MSTLCRETSSPETIAVCSETMQTALGGEGMVRALIAGMGLLPLLLADAQAFAPSEDNFIGLEPQRIYHTEPLTPHRLAKQPAWE
jgi:hypothetical protein